VSGAAALIIQQRPTITPGELKSLLRETATRLRGGRKESFGAGEINLGKALTAPTPEAAAAKRWSSGTGSLEASRGSAHLQDSGVELSGERDIFGNAWDATRWAQEAAAGTSWSGGMWNGSTWTGAAASGDRWTGVAWTGLRWSGLRWTDAAWSANVWEGLRWSGLRWTGTTWTGLRWSEAVWAGAGWS
jgi:serine protease AprX